MPFARIRNSELHLLASVRIVLAVLLLVRTTPLLAWTSAPFLHGNSPLLGWPTDAYHAAMWGWSWPPVIVAALCIVRTFAILALLFGYFSRMAGLVAGVSGYLILLQDELGYVQTLHLLYASAILLGLADSGCAFALRRDRVISAPSSIGLMRIWVASIYFWASLAKIRIDWLSGEALALFHQYGGLAGSAADVLFATETRRIVIAVSIALVEFVLGPALLYGRTRKVALLCAYVFHCGVEIVARPDLIGYAMSALLLVFLSPKVQGASVPASAGQTTST